MNIGAKFAYLKHQEKCLDSQNLCLVTHDIDMLPLNSSLRYDCQKSPQLLATNASQFKYKMPYLAYFGGVVAVKWNDYTMVNGMSNKSVKF